MKEGETSVLRFLPDADPNNDFFWRERLMIKLPFPGVKGQADSRPVMVQVPCMEMYGESCPVLTEVRPWFKSGDKSLEDLGRKYWKKRSYLFQHTVVETDMNEENVPENPIRRTMIGPQIFQIIKSALLDPELEELPTDYTHGLDFRITKTSKGGYADYSTSKWSRRERPLSEEEKAAIDSHGLFNLNDFLPKKPSEVEVEVIKQMFEASVEGEPYDPDKFSQYFRPAGMSANTGDPNSGSESKSKSEAPKAAPKAAPKKEEPKQEAKEEAKEEEPPFDADDKKSPEESAGSNTQDILAMIRSRQSK
jgi:hypothetical protein